MSNDAWRTPYAMHTMYLRVAAALRPPCMPLVCPVPRSHGLPHHRARAAFKAHPTSPQSVKPQKTLSCSRHHPRAQHSLQHPHPLHVAFCLVCRPHGLSNRRVLAGFKVHQTSPQSVKLGKTWSCSHPHPQAQSGARQHPAMPFTARVPSWYLIMPS